MLLKEAHLSLPRKCLPSFDQNQQLNLHSENADQCPLFLPPASVLNNRVKGSQAKEKTNYRDADFELQASSYLLLYRSRILEGAHERSSCVGRSSSLNLQVIRHHKCITFFLDSENYNNSNYSWKQGSIRLQVKCQTILMSFKN